MVFWRVVAPWEIFMDLMKLGGVPDEGTLAQRVADNDVLWVQRRPMASWVAAWLRQCAGETQVDAAASIGSDAKTFRDWCRRMNPPVWKAAQWPRVAEVLMSALSLRRTKLGLEQDEMADAEVCAYPCAGEGADGSILFEMGGGAGADDACDEPYTDDWAGRAHAAQVPPEGDWRVWLMMGGRGAGKTRAGAEWVRGLVESGAAKRVALVGPSLHEVREVMIEGASGLRSIGAPGRRPVYEATRRRLVWPRLGAVAQVFSAEDPDGLRGSQFDAAWCDEIGAWARDVETWRVLAFALRLGARPRVMATTTPRPRALVKLLAERAERGAGGVVMTRASTRANAENLSPEFVSALEEDYGGTEVGRQEIDGELIEDMVGAMWSRAVIEAHRARPEEAEELERVVVAVDPPAGAGAGSDACGIVVAGVKAGVVFVLADATVRGLRPAEWAARVAAAAEAYGAGEVTAEGNQGGALVEDVLREACGVRMRVRMRHAARSKRDRAAPVSAMYEQGRVRHVRVLKELEDEMCAFGVEPPAGRRARSPDRVDALVWAVSELTRKPPPLPRIDVL